MDRYRLGVDVGGTFTDFILMNEANGEFVNFKAPSRPDDPASAILEGIVDLTKREAVSPEAISYFVNGTTISLNTVIQRSGAKTGLLITSGFRDVLTLRRVRLPDAPSFYADVPTPLIRRKHVKEINERMLASGKVYRPLDLDEVERAAAELVADGVEALAICFLHSYRNPEHERAAKDRITSRFPDLYVSTSAEIWPQQREYERCLITVINSHVGDKLKHYFDHLTSGARELGLHSRVFSTKSNGGIASAERAGQVPVETLLSGPASGVIAATHIGKLAGQHKVIAFDMGGTSADVSVIDGDFAYSSESTIGDFPVIMPAIDISSIGAGGGSIAWTDRAGVLKVGPTSAGADPGPACYGRGGSQPTVTDAYVALGLIDPHEFLGGTFPLDRRLAELALERLGATLGLGVEETAASVLSVATSNMYAQFLPLMAQHGVDQRDFAILAYGGAGPTHAFLLAEEVGVPRVIVPTTPGTLCALGCLLADFRADFVKTAYYTVDEHFGERMEAAFAELEHEARQWLEAEQVEVAESYFIRSADMRYKGQSYEIAVRLDDGNVDPLEPFHERYEAIYGYFDPAAPVEVVDLRLQVVGVTPKPQLRSANGRRGQKGGPRAVEQRQIWYQSGTLVAPVYRRSDLAAGDEIAGPAIVTQYDTTVFIPPNFDAHVDEWLNIIGDRREKGDRP